jgi:cell shape-determining protein MreC
LVWEGEGLKTAKVVDIAKSSLILPGDEVYTTGFQGVFPSDVLVGEIKKISVTEADDFKTVIVKLGVDYSSIRFVEFLTDKRISKSDSLINLVR